MTRLVFCFDGTWNRLDAQNPTNVVLTAESVLPSPPDGVKQLIFYDEGVGSDPRERLSGGMFGAGLVRNLADAYRFLIFNYTPGDDIFVFGFSRGAFTARSFCGLLANCGVLRRRDAAKSVEAISLYQSRLDDTDPASERMLQWRAKHSPEVCVDDREDAWRVGKVDGHVAGSAPRLSVRFLGLWDTVGSLGFPDRYKALAVFDRRHLYHDIDLKPFIRAGRHAVAIDERRLDFAPTLWEGVDDLNRAAGFDIEAGDAPYRQKWFPGDHGSVGGGGNLRSLSDQALEWVWDGARGAGLTLDLARHSRAFELSPSHREALVNMDYDREGAKKGLMTGLMGLLRANDRKPGPATLYEVDISARRRWKDLPGNLKGGKPYRPRTLTGVAAALDALKPEALGLALIETKAEPGSFDLYEVVPGDTLGKIARKAYGDARLYPLIMAANAHQIVDPNRIYAGRVLRIPHRAPG